MRPAEPAPPPRVSRRDAFPPGGLVIRFTDVRYALRLWRRHPAMIVVAGLSLGLGVGATTTMYSVVNRVAHYDLGFADEERLVVLWRANPERGMPRQSLNYLMQRALLEHGNRSNQS